MSIRESLPRLARGALLLGLCGTAGQGSSRTPKRQPNCRRLAEPQIVVRIGHEYANFIDEARPQLLGLHRLGRELRFRRHEANPTGEPTIRIAVDLDRRFRPRMHFPEIRLRDISPHPFRIDHRQREHRL